MENKQWVNVEHNVENAMQQSGIDDKFVDWKGRPIHKLQHGGMKAALFVLGSITLEALAGIAVNNNLVIYLSGQMGFSLSKASTHVSNFTGTQFLLGLVGGFIADAYLNRFWTIMIFSCIDVIGYLLLVFQAHFYSLRPHPCNDNVVHDVECKPHATTKQYVVFFVALYIIAFGGGGVKPNMPSHGGDQFDFRNPNERRKLASFFNRYFFGLSVGSILASTVVVWVHTNVGSDWGFGISAVTMLLSLFCHLGGATFYRIKVPEGSPLTRIAQVLVAALRKFNVPLPMESSRNLYMKNEQNSADSPLSHTGQLKFLDKAAILVEGRPEGKPGDHINPWKLCTVAQVEETKAIIRLLPILLCTIMFNCALVQLVTFTIQQANTTNTKMGKNFHMPAASISVVSLSFLIVLVPIYDLVIVPSARKITGNEMGITQLQRMGVGLLVSSLSMAVAAMVEIKRKQVAREHGLMDKENATVPMSVFWLAPQSLIFGVAEMFTSAGLLDFLYSQSPIGMRSLATSLGFASLALGSYLGSFMVTVVNMITSIEGAGWISGNNLNKGRLELFYMLLCLMSTGNFLQFLFWARWYKYRAMDLGVCSAPCIELRTMI